MKNIILIFTLSLTFKAQCGEFLYSDFWYAAKPMQMKLKIQSVQDSLEEECEEHSQTLQRFAEFSAEDVKFYNSLPLKKQMGSKFEAVFKVVNLKSDFEVLNKSQVLGLLNLDFNAFEIAYDQAQFNILNYDPNSLSALSVKAGAGLGPLQIKLSTTISGEVFLLIGRRDMACDLVSKKINLSLSAPVKYILTQTSLTKIETYTAELSQSLGFILNSNASPYAKAAQIGILAAQFQKSTEAASILVERIFNKLFLPHSLDLSSAWKYKIDGSLYFDYETSLTQKTDNILIQM